MVIFKYFALFSLLLLTVSCNKDNNDTTPPAEPIEAHWSVVNVSGGIAGYNCDFEKQDYVWHFEAGELIRTFDGGMTCISVAVVKDTLVYSVLEDTGREFLEIDSNVFGEMIFSNDSLFINTNSHPSGSGADGFAYVLVK